MPVDESLRIGRLEISRPIPVGLVLAEHMINDNQQMMHHGH